MNAGIRYLRTHDGASLAYSDAGQGLPLVAMPTLPFSHLQRVAATSQLAEWLAGLGRGRRLLQYDARGTGMSDRDAADFSLETQVRDLERLLDVTGVERAALFGVMHAGVIAAAFAAAHPDRVSHLVLWHAYVRGTDMFRDPHSAAVAELVQKNWELFTDAVTFTNFGWSSGAAAREFAEIARVAVSAESGRAAFSHFFRYDVSALLARVTAPTLVVTREEPPVPSLEAARELVGSIPDAQLLILAGRGIAPWTTDVPAMLRVVDEFLPVATPPAAPTTLEALSGRELEVLALLSAGRSNQQIADDLGVSVGTIKTHVSSILGKLQAANRTEAVARARAAALIH